VKTAGRRLDVSHERVKELLSELRDALASAETLDEETLELARSLDQDMDMMIEKSEPYAPELEQAIALEARFAANHPAAEKIVRELVAVLGRIGI
jgi:predicted transcriptional regulator